MSETATSPAPAAAQPEVYIAPVITPTFTATFTVDITGIKTATINGMDAVIKQVDWTLKGKEADQTFELPQSTVLGDPSKDTFLKVSNVTLDIVTAWVKSRTENLDAIKSHIQFVLNKQVEIAVFKTVHMPWLPEVVDAPTEPMVPPTAPV